MKTISCGIGKLSRMNSKSLRELKDVLLINDPWGEPIVTVIPYSYYLELQNNIIDANEMIKRLEEIVWRQQSNA